MCAARRLILAECMHWCGSPISGVALQGALRRPVGQAAGSRRHSTSWLLSCSQKIESLKLARKEFIHRSTAVHA